jgi:2-polyprenyl-3-methyl-5-hydroxy-6-metoxy-1,4-benzoquinol methylase
LRGDEPAMRIDRIDSEEDLRPLFNHIQETWQELGETEPHWSVLAAEVFLQKNIEEYEGEFFRSGINDVDRLLRTLDRNMIDYSSFQSCLDYGCGLGRVTRWLAEKFKAVYAYDISKSHLDFAEQYFAQQGVDNISLHHLKYVEELHTLPKVDLIFSVIVLQHNPPPLIALMIRQMLKALNPGGVAIFQVPTYRLGYEFNLRRYLAREMKRKEMEMHSIPQSEVFNILLQEGCTPIEILEDEWAGMREVGLSNTFLVLKDG